MLVWLVLLERLERLDLCGSPRLLKTPVSTTTLMRLCSLPMYRIVVKTLRNKIRCPFARDSESEEKKQDEEE